MVRSLRDWQRLGSEAEATDRERGLNTPTVLSAHSDALPRDALETHFADDLGNEEICDDREEALDALVRGYRHGG